MSAKARTIALLIVLSCGCICGCQSPTEETKQLYWTAETSSPAVMPTDKAHDSKPQSGAAECV